MCGKWLGIRTWRKGPLVRDLIENIRENERKTKIFAISRMNGWIITKIGCRSVVGLCGRLLGVRILL